MLFPSVEVLAESELYTLKHLCRLEMQLGQLAFAPEVLGPAIRDQDCLLPGAIWLDPSCYHLETENVLIFLKKVVFNT